MDVVEFEALALDSVALASSLDDISKIKTEFLGKKSFLLKQFALLPSLPVSERKTLASLLNECSARLKLAISQKEQLIKDFELCQKLKAQVVDVTLPSRLILSGGRHPLSKMLSMVRLSLASMGMKCVDGPEIEDEHHAFDALNVPADHPAREMQDTLYLSYGGKLLRPHTSSVQVRIMEQSPDFPVSVFSVGKVYRDDDDATHTPMFHQVEGLYLDRNVSMMKLKSFIAQFVFSMLGNVRLRFRPSFFPFTSPSAEVDIAFGEEGKWVEILGCGIVHPSVLKNFGVPEGYTGFAFGCGIERLAMIKYNISDLRMLFSSKLSWLLAHSSC